MNHYKQLFAIFYNLVVIKKIFRFAILGTLILSSPLSSKAQSCDQGFSCSNFTNRFPSGTFATTSAVFATVSTQMNAGNWTVFAVTLGNTYDWTYCNLYGGSQNWDAQLTLYDFSTGAFLCYQNNSGVGSCPNAPYMRWTATFSGTVRLLTSVVNCQSNSGSPFSTLVWRQAAQGSTCNNWSTNPTSAQYNASGGNGTFTVSSGTGGCPFTAVSNNSWINNINYPQTGTVSYNVSQNTGSTRNGTISIKDANLITQATFTVNQSAGSSCVTSVAPSSVNANPSTINSGNNSTLSIVGGTLGTNANWAWYKNSCGGSSIGTGSSIVVNPTATTTYFVRAEGGCSPNTTCVSVTVTVTSGCVTSVTPSSASASPGTINSGGSSILTVNGGTLGTGASWKWYVGTCSGTSIGTGNSISVSPTTTTNYYVRAEGGCSPNTVCVSVNVTVTAGCINSVTPNSASASPATIVLGGNSVLTLNGGSLGTGASWKWYAGGCGVTSIGTGNSISVSPTSTTTYFVRGEGGCSPNTACVNTTVTVTPTSMSTLTINNEIPGNDQLVQKVELWSRNTSQTAPLTKLAADGSRATTFRFVNNTGINSNNIKFWIASDPFGNNSDLSGYIVDYNVTSNVITAKLQHPKYSQSTTLTSSDQIRIVDVTNPNSNIYTFPISIYRGPVIMLHGLWGDPGAFDPMEIQIRSTGQYLSEFTYRVNYWQSNSSSFYENRNVVKDAITTMLRTARNRNISAGRVDVIGHSMGGILARDYLQSSAYHNRNDIHKLITINTPHSGSQLANFVLNPFHCESLLARAAISAYIYTAYPGATVSGGALRDLKVNSDAIHNLNVTRLNTGIVPTHVITSEANPSLFNAAGGFILAYLGIINGCGNYTVSTFMDYMFFSKPSDLIVSKPSQGGGLNQQYINHYSELAHTKVEKDLVVINKVIKLLNTNSSDLNVFTQNGFNPEDLSSNTHYRGQQNDTLETLIQGGITIVTPLTNDVVNPGSTIPIIIKSNSGVNRMILEAFSNEERVFVKDTLLANGTINYKIPMDAFGKVGIIVFGLNNSGLVDYDTVSLKISVNSVLQTISYYPDTLYIPENHTASLNVSGTFANGKTYNLRSVEGVQYYSADSSIAKYNTNNTVVGRKTGVTKINVSYLGKFVSIPIVVLPGDKLTKEPNEVIDTVKTLEVKVKTLLYPNPNDGTFTLVYGSDQDENIVILVYNQLGQKVDEFERKTINRSIRTTIKLNNSLPNGIYYIKVVSNNHNYSTKIIVER